MRVLTHLSGVAKLSLSFLLILIAVSASYFIIWQQSSTVDSAIASDKSVRQIDQTLRLLDSSVQAERSAVALLMLTGDVRYLSEIENASTVVRGAISQLRDRPEENIAAKAADIETAYQTWHADMTMRQVALMQRPDTVDIARALDEQIGKVELILALRAG